MVKINRKTSSKEKTYQFMRMNCYTNSAVKCDLNFTQRTHTFSNINWSTESTDVTYTFVKMNCDTNFSRKPGALPVCSLMGAAKRAIFCCKKKQTHAVRTLERLE